MVWKIKYDVWKMPRPTRYWGVGILLERLKNNGFPPVDWLMGVCHNHTIPGLDIDSKTKPTIIANWDFTPIKDRIFNHVFFDPPYDGLYLNGFRESQRITKRYLSVLHLFRYPNPKGFVRRQQIAVDFGPNKKARWLMTYEREGTDITKY